MSYAKLVKALFEKTFWVGLVLGAVLVTGCGERVVEEEVAEPAGGDGEEAELVARGTAATAALKMGLGAQLKAAMGSGGHGGAIEVCRQVAEVVTKTTSDTFEGLEVGRTSLKVRNPDNRPDSVDESVLREFESMKAAGSEVAPVYVAAGEGQGARYYVPIMAEAICLNCHGARDVWAPVVRVLLDELYPDDEATGYEEGDVRGAFRVSFENP
jgi:hypothetical protein